MKEPAQILNELIAKYNTARDFARAINEHASDIIRWRYGKCAIKMRAVVSICRLHPEIKPHDLNKDFPADLTLVFGDKK